MAVTLRQLCEKASYLYGMRIIAGENGTGSIVQWIHTLEDVETGGFIHGGELIFTTGIARQGDDWLLTFVKSLCEREASGLVVNIGPYITKIPLEVIEYCNQVSFPLLEVPWKTRLVDITRDFSNQIFQDEKEDENLADILKKIIFDPANVTDYLPALAQKNFHLEGTFCIVGIDIDFLERNRYRQKMFQSHLLRRVERMHGNIGYFVSVEAIFLVLNDFQSQNIREMVTLLEAQENSEWVTLKIAVGKNETGAENLHSNYHKVTQLLKLARKNEETPLFYDDFGSRKLLLSVSEPEVLEEFYNEVLGKLARYDRESETNYMGLLKQYLDMDGSVQMVADATFVHRNTINYQLNKIKKILGHDFNTLESRFQLILAFKVKDLI